MEPRVYLYKITFEEILDWYWGVHKEKRHGEYYMGTPYTHKWKWEFYTPKKQILQFFEFNAKGYREAKLLEDRLIRPDLNNPLCLNENVGGQYSLAAATLGAYSVHQDKDEDGKSKHAVRAGRNRAAVTHSAKDENGKSINAVKCGKAAHKEKDENGKSINGIKFAQRLNSIKDELGRSVVVVQLTNQLWESTLDGYRSNAGNVAQHNKRNGWDPGAKVRVYPSDPGV